MTSIDSKISKAKAGLLTLAALAVGIVIGVAVNRGGSSSSPASAQKEKTTVTVPTQPAKAETARTTEPSAPSLPTFENWDPFQEMRDMQARMNQMFHQSIARFRMNPQLDIFEDEAGYSSSLDVRDLKDRYEVRAYLPDAKASEAKVNLNDNRLTVEISNQQAEQHVGKNTSVSTQEWGRYEQMVQLTGNLKPDQMKVERNEHELLITIPKAAS